jgi:hypothetical protein
MFTSLSAPLVDPPVDAFTENTQATFSLSEMIAAGEWAGEPAPKEGEPTWHAQQTDIAPLS